MKKVLITTLVLVMCLAFGSTAFAAASTAGAAFTDIAGHEAEFELTALAALGIYSGDSGLGGTVNPDDPITRAQFCKVVVTAMGRGTTAAGLAGLQPTFTDGASIPSWAWGYVNVAVYMGIINGYADGSFGADNPVTYAEAVTMLIRAVSGHAAQVGAGVWPYNYLFYGVDNGFTGSVDVGFANLPATRGDVARMLFATMQINKLNAKGEELDDTAILTDRFDTGLLQSVDLANNDCGLGSLAEKVYVAGAADLNGLLNVNVRFVTDGTDILAMGVNEDATVITGVFDDFDNSDDPTLLVLDDGTEVPYDNGEALWDLNTVHQSSAIYIGTPGDGLQPGDELVINVNEDGEAAYIFDTRFERGFVDEIDLSSVDPDGTENDTFVVLGVYNAAFFIPESCTVTINGEPADRDDLAEYDVVDVALWFDGVSSTYAAVVRATREVVEGTVDGTTTIYPGPVERATIDGTTYTFYDRNITSVTWPNEDSKVKYGLDADGKIFVEIGYEASTPFVYLLGYTENGDGSATCTADVRGEETTFNVTDDAGIRSAIRGRIESPGTMDDFVWIDVDTATNTIDDVQGVAFSGAGFVISNSDGAITLGDSPIDPSSYSFIAADAGATIYVEDEDGSFAYVSQKDLVGDDDYMLRGNDAAAPFFEAGQCFLYLIAP